MFDNLISNLPFNPSLIDQVSFYSKRLRQESGVRRAGFALIALTMALQVFATINPAQASVACDPSNNDIIQCGFKTKTEAVNHCNNNDQNFKKILANYGITCAKLATATEKTVSSNSFGNQLISLGRKPFQKPGEYSVNISGVGNLFWRPLSSWGIFSSKMLATQTDDGQMVMVMFECGNLVTLKDFKLEKPQPPADLNIVKKNQPAGEVKWGDTIDYTLAFTNKGGTAAFFSVNDILPDQVEFVSSNNNGWIFENHSPKLKWYNNTPPFYTFGNTDAFGTPGFVFAKVKVKNNIPSGTTICNRAYLQDVVKGSSTPRNSSETQVCNTVIVTCPTGQVLKDDRITCEQVPVPDAVCLSLSAAPVTDDKTGHTYKFTAKASTANGASIKTYKYDFGDNKTDSNNSDKLENSTEHKFDKPNTYDVSVTLVTSVADKPALTCKTKVTISPPEESPTISIKKQARNITKNQDDANGKKADAGDVIEYTLTTSNISTVDSKDTEFKTEDLSDVLEYADLDLTSLDGGSFDAQTQVLAWNQKVTIKAGQSVTKKFKVTVKSPIPSTPRPDTQSTKTSGDLVMHNWYGNPIDISLPKTTIKVIEQTKDLPHTGPGESLAIGFLTMTVVGYFFARSRLMAKELLIVKNEHTSAGGA